MKIILCIDDDGGMLFNNRRQSKDIVLLEKVKEIVGGKRLWISDFSKSLFDDHAYVDSEMLDKALEQDFCFVENLNLAPYAEKIDEIYLFKWNRRYPSDKKIDISIADIFRLVRSEDFTGNSHEKITMEVWKK